MKHKKIHFKQWWMMENIRACALCFFYIFFFAQVKSVPNFMGFCCKSEKCCNFALLLSLFLAFYKYLWHFMILFWHFYDTFWNFWPVTLFCGKFTFFVAINAHFRVKLFWHKPCLCKSFVFFYVWSSDKKCPYPTVLPVTLKLAYFAPPKGCGSDFYSKLQLPKMPENSNIITWVTSW